MHYLIIAGEASGDLHASHLIKALRAEDSEARFTILGGDKMATEAGVRPAVHISEMAFMGFSEVLRNLGTVRRNMAIARKLIDVVKPDVFIPVDYPSFNLKIAAHAAERGVPVIYYISPKIWAWKQWRIRDIRRYVKRVMCILPFEPTFYGERGYTADYVGNPSVAEVDADIAAAAPRADFLKKYGLRDRPLIALMPGSRTGEIRNNLPVMRVASDAFPQYRPVIIAAPGMGDDIYRQYAGENIPVLRPANATEVLVHCRGALVTSGTATLETALAGIPQVVCYRSNGSKLTHDVMKRVLSVDYVSLPNLILGSEAVPEMLLHLCTAEAVADRLAPLLRPSSVEREAQLAAYARMREVLGTSDAAATAAQRIVDAIKK